MFPMEIWEPDWKTVSKMNILKSSKKQSRKDALVEEATAGLPDVVADLSLCDTYNGQTVDMTCDSASMHGFTNNMDESMLEYSSHFTPITETTAFRRIPHPAPPTPEGLGAGPMTLETPESNWNGLEASSFQKRIDPCTPWRQAGQWTQTTQSSVPPIFVNTQLRPDNGIGPCSTEPDSFRIRSVSSEPRGPNMERGERRNRCSSANRNRQARHRQQISAISHNPTIISPPLSPPMSPPAQRVQWLGSSSSNMPMHSSTFVPPLSLSQYHRTESQSREASRETGCAGGHTTEFPGPSRSYGYQVADLDALLTQASPTRPANLPMVLASSTKLHNMRLTHGNQSVQTARSFLPLGIIVNAVFKTRDWLYVRTAHGAEGYVPYRVCLPLGILPLNRGSVPNDQILPPAGLAWESAGNNNLTSPSPYRPRAGTGKGFSPIVESHHRSRPRARRRHMVASEIANQTDSQKLHPSLPNGENEARERENIRETFQSISYAPHLV